ncbi:hypothetical protein KKG44_03845, partial [Patescibacteria group bacterium]|nr:hypothetical protein [Patescibacteria group bacterium]
AYIELTFENRIQEFQQHRATFIDIFRHGLMHEFFAKNAGISRHHTELFGISQEGKLVLDADQFHQIFRDSCNRLKSLMDSSEELTQRIADRYLALQRYNFNEFPSGVLSQSTTYTRASGATGPSGPISFTTTATPSFPPDEADS